MEKVSCKIKLTTEDYLAQTHSHRTNLRLKATAFPKLMSVLHLTLGAHLSHLHHLCAEGQSNSSEAELS